MMTEEVFVELDKQKGFLVLPSKINYTFIVIHWLE